MLEEIKNFRRVDDGLATAGQPTEPQFAAIGQAGFEAVINLGLAHQAYSLPDEKALVEKMGMAYFHIPVAFASPQASDMDRFLEVMDRCAGRKVLVHCAANYRASCFAALYGLEKLGWTKQKADETVRSVWNPDEIWQRFMHAMTTKTER